MVSHAGMLTPSTHLPIYPSKKLLEAMPEYVLVRWNCARISLEQQAALGLGQGCFIIHILKLELV